MTAPSTMAPSAIQYTHPPVSRVGDCVGLMLTWASATCGRAMTASIAAPSGSIIRSTLGWRERIAAILPEGVLPRAWGHAGLQRRAELGKARGDRFLHHHA